MAYRPRPRPAARRCGCHRLRWCRPASADSRARRSSSPSTWTAHPSGPSRTIATASPRSRGATAVVSAARSSGAVPPTAASRSSASSALLDQTSVTLEHRRADVGGEPGERRARIQYDDHVGVERRQPREQRVARALQGQREARHAHQVTGPRLGRGERLDGDLPLGTEGGDEGALGARLDHHHADAGVPVGDRRGGELDALRRERGPDQVAMGPGAVRAGVHAVRVEAGGRHEHGDGTSGVVGDGGGHHVLAARGQVGHLHHHVDQGLAGVDHPARGEMWGFIRGAPRRSRG